MCRGRDKADKRSSTGPGPGWGEADVTATCDAAGTGEGRRTLAVGALTGLRARLTCRGLNVGEEAAVEALEAVDERAVVAPLAPVVVPAA